MLAGYRGEGAGGAGGALMAKVYNPQSERTREMCQQRSRNAFLGRRRPQRAQRRISDSHVPSQGRFISQVYNAQYRPPASQKRVRRRPKGVPRRDLAVGEVGDRRTVAADKARRGESKVWAFLCGSLSRVALGVTALITMLHFALMKASRMDRSSSVDGSGAEGCGRQPGLLRIWTDLD